MSGRWYGSTFPHQQLLSLPYYLYQPVHRLRSIFIRVRNLYVFQIDSFEWELHLLYDFPSLPIYSAQSSAISKVHTWSYVCNDATILASTTLATVSGGRIALCALCSWLISSRRCTFLPRSHFSSSCKCQCDTFIIKTGDFGHCKSLRRDITLWWLHQRPHVPFH